MSELIVESDERAKSAFESYLREHPENAAIERSSGADGDSLVSLVITNMPVISASLAVLISTLRGRGIYVRVSRDGVEVSVGEEKKGEEKS